eukprot:757927-Hanusia_phi.AAC.4
MDPFLSGDGQDKKSKGESMSHKMTLDEAFAALGWGLDCWPSEQDVKRRHRELMLQFHPDKAPSDKLEEYTHRSMRLNRAKEIILRAQGLGNDGDNGVELHKSTSYPDKYACTACLCLFADNSLVELSWSSCILALSRNVGTKIPYDKLLERELANFKNNYVTSKSEVSFSKSDYFNASRSSREDIQSCEQREAQPAARCERSADTKNMEDDGSSPAHTKTDKRAWGNQSETTDSLSESDEKNAGSPLPVFYAEDVKSTPEQRRQKSVRDEGSTEICDEHLIQADASSSKGEDLDQGTLGLFLLMRCMILQQVLSIPQPRRRGRPLSSISTIRCCTKNSLQLSSRHVAMTMTMIACGPVVGGAEIESQAAGGCEGRRQAGHSWRHCSHRLCGGETQRWLRSPHPCADVRECDALALVARKDTDVGMALKIRERSLSLPVAPASGERRNSSSSSWLTGLDPSGSGSLDRQLWRDQVPQVDVFILLVTPS